jgi:aminopeptidase N
MRIWGVSFLCVFVTSCTAKFPTVPKESAASQPILTRHMAESRAAQVSNVKYAQDFFFDKTSDIFSGTEEITFDWKPSSEPLKLDFFKGIIKKTVFNGHELDLKYDGQEIILDARLHGNGTQHLVIEFARAFDHEGTGLYRFVDREDKRVYIYSNLEPNFANMIFPCFDQPDLKATFNTKVHAPRDWVVTTSTLPLKVEENDQNDQPTVWTFPTSPKMATYVWSLAAGPYKILEDKSATYPMRLFVRQTMAAQVHPDEWFPIARAALKFYGEFFSTPYPYKKMDLVIVPDFEPSGMENVAAIALTERDLKKGQHTHAERTHIASLVMHEIAHMWFGDLVTTKWWNDLWLNESFATIMASLAMSKTSFGQEGWRDFFQHDKLWAYDNDDKVTTHPIQGEVQDTIQADSQFDGITYGKGASVLKQMMFFIGEDKFRAGLKTYFDHHRDGNAQLADFIGDLSAASQKPLDHWSQRWLKAAGLNTVKMEVTCQGDKIAKVDMLQSATSDHPLLRDQVMQVALLRGKEKMEVRESVKVVLTGDRVTIKEFRGRPCDAVIFPNYHDHGYAKFRFDENSLNQVKASIGKISDPFIRQMSWSMLWSMVLDSEMSVREFAEIWLREYPKETDSQNVVVLNEYAVDEAYKAPSILMYFPPGRELKAWRKSVDQMLWTEIEKAKPGTDRQRYLVDALIDLASQPDSYTKLAAMLDGSLKLPKYDLEQDRRWLALKRLAAGNFESVSKRIEEELKQDPSSAGQLAAMAAQVAMPSIDVKKNSLESVAADNSDWTFAQRRTVMKNLFPTEQQSLSAEIAQKFYEHLEKFVGAAPKSDYFLSTFMQLAPTPLEPEITQQAQLFLTKHTGLPSVVHRKLKELIEFGGKYQKARAKAEGIPQASQE